MLTLNDIQKSFGPTRALRGVNLTLEKGEVHALIGENGAGKSTLMNILAGALLPDAGTMTLNGSEYRPTGPLDARRRGLAMIHQELSLMPDLTVAENILPGLEEHRFGWINKRAMRRRAAEILGYFDHLSISPDALVRDLPIATRQIVEICRALAANARLILMDEPTSSLHRDDVARLFDVIRKLSADGVSVVYISHFLEEIREICDVYTVLRDGATVDSGRLADVTDSRLVAMMVGREVTELFPQRLNQPGDVILEIDRLLAPPVLEDASFSLRRGEILGIAGLMGSGRTELIKALFGLDKAARGSIKWHGESTAMRVSGPAERIRQGFGYVSEDRKNEGLALSMSIADNLTITRLGDFSRFGLIDRQKQAETARAISGRVGAKIGQTNDAVSTLSGGNQQKIAIGRLLHQQADILLLDEPTRGIDVGSKAQVYELIVALAAEGRAVILVSSYLPELFGLCDRLAVLSQGRLSPTKDVSEWSPESVMEAALSIAG